MARTKNVGGGPGDEDRRPPPRQPVDPKGKATKKLATRKHKYPDAEIVRAAVVAEAADRAERGGARSGVVIVDPLPPGAMEGIERVEHLHGGPPRSVMVLDSVMLLMRFCLRGSHSSRHCQQSRLSRQRRQSRHHSHSYAALAVPVL